MEAKFLTFTLLFHFYHVPYSPPAHFYTKTISSLIGPSVWFTFQQGGRLRPIIFAFDFLLSETLISTSLVSQFLPSTPSTWSHLTLQFCSLVFSPLALPVSPHIAALFLIARFTLGDCAHSSPSPLPPTPPPLPLPGPVGSRWLKTRRYSYIISHNCRGDRVS